MSKRTISYGKHAVGGARKASEVTMTVCVEPTVWFDTKKQQNYTKGEHFSVTGDVWNATHTDIIRGGQCVDYITEKIAKDRNTKNIRALWEVFHLQQMDAIPKRFRTAIVEFVEGKAETVVLERKRCQSYLLKATEKVTDYGTFTDGTVTVKTGDGITEVIRLTQCDEKTHPITERASKAIGWLYEDAPGAEDVARTAKIDTNAKEYVRAKEQAKRQGVAAIKRTAQGIVNAVSRGAVGGDWSAALDYVRMAERALSKTVEK